MTMVERVARAMHAQSILDARMAMAREGMIKIPVELGYMFKDWDDTTQISRDSMLAQARAALAAMREPSPAMEDAAFLVPQDATLHTVLWRAMIDAALSEKGG